MTQPKPFSDFSRKFPRNMNFEFLYLEFGRAKIPMVRLNEPDRLPKRIKKVRLGIYLTNIQPKIR